MIIKEKIKKINYKSSSFNIFTLNSGVKVKYTKTLPDNVVVGSFVNIDGDFVNDERYGKTFVANSVELKELEFNILPIVIDGIGDKKAEQIIEQCGSYKIFIDEPFKIYEYTISESSLSLLTQIRNCRSMFNGIEEIKKEDFAKQLDKQIKGLGRKKILSWIDIFEKDNTFTPEEFLKDENIIEFLASDQAKEIYNQILNLEKLEKIYFSLLKFKISNFTIKQILKDFKEEDVLEKIEKDPYFLFDYGVSFPVIDNIAINELNKEKNDYGRVVKGVKYLIMQHEAEGGTFVYFEDFKNESANFLDIDLNLLEDIIDKELSLKYNSEFVLEDDRLYRRVIYFTEKKMGRMLSEKAALPNNIIPIEIINYLAKTSLSDEQKSAVVGVLEKKISILTGGPGTGKTTTIKEVCNCLDKMNKKYILAAPTGKAAKRMTESTGRSASTIHRMLEYKMMGNTSYFARNEKYQLWTDYIIIDESSMVDAFILNSFLKAVKSNTSIIFVGDIDQLPSVSMGSVLIDMKDSGKIPVFTLTEIFRQSAESTIVRNAYHIKNNEDLEIGEDFIFNQINDYGDVRKYISENEIWPVLCPMKVGNIGTKKINELIQELTVYKNNKQVYFNGNIYHEGDKVIQLVNDYNKNVFNGEIGIIKEISQNEITIFFADNDVKEQVYKFNELYKIELAYAVTIHKSQGSEADNLLIIINGNDDFLSKELIYTAITRAKKKIVVLSTKPISFFKELKSSSKRLTNLNNLIL